MQPSTRWPTLSPAWLQPPPRRRSLVLQRGHDTGGQGHWVTKARGGQGRRGFPQTPPPRRGRGAHSLCHHVPHVAGVQSGVLLLLLRRGVHGKELRIQRRRLPARAQDTALAPPPPHHHDDKLLPDKSRSLSEHPPLESSLELSLPPMHAHVCKLTTHLSPAGAPLLRHRSP